MVTPEPAEEPVNLAVGEGHRGRLLERFSANGLGAFHDHEIIELILTFALPRKDTKPIAKELLKRFKTVGGVFNASPEKLQEVKGLGERSAQLFPLIRDTMAHCLKERFQKQPHISHQQDVEEYLRLFYGYRQDEYVAALFLDSSNRILCTEMLATGTVNQCAVYPRSVIGIALKQGATTIILAHNHPGGALTPSESDWMITERLFAICKLIEIPLLDHIIITRQKIVSLRGFSRWPK